MNLKSVRKILTLKVNRNMGYDTIHMTEKLFNHEYALLNSFCENPIAMNYGLHAENNEMRLMSVFGLETSVCENKLYIIYIHI